MTISLTLTFGKILSRFTDFIPAQTISREPQRVQSVANTISASFKMTLDDSRFEVLVPQLEAFSSELRPFAYEGAGMGLMLLDCSLPWKNRLKAFINGPGAPYICHIHVGAGLALAKLHRQPERYFTHLDPLLCWLAVDGYGLYKATFSRQSIIEEQMIPAHLSDYGRCVFDQGIGRSLWFTNDGNAERIAAILTCFPQTRKADLWAGVGFACAYAGGILDRTTLESLQIAAGPYGPQLALAGVLAANRCQRVGNQAPHTDLACEVFCNLSSDRAAQIASLALQGVPIDKSGEPAYKIWRQRIAAELAALIAKESNTNLKQPFALTTLP